MKKKKIVEIIFFILLFVFSWFLMWKTFYISKNGNLEIAGKVSSDFAATIPLIRSFSFGQNWPPQYPIFAGPPIRYHFIFYAIVGLLEKVGMPLDWALNSLSILSFFLLLLVIYYLTKAIFKSRFTSALACLLFLFNGSLAFLDFFKKFPLSVHTLTDILHHDSFLAFGPYYGNKIISAFWSLNIYTNQRHLALAYAIFLLLVLIMYQASKNDGKLNLNKTLIWGIVVGLFPFIHLSVFAMMEMALLIFLVIYPHLRKNVLAIIGLSVLIALPQIMYSGGGDSKNMFFHPGYLIESLSFFSFIKYWFLNLGLITLLSPIGFFLAKRQQKKILLPFLGLFVIGNLFQFSPEIAGNHKFFNLFVIGANIFAAYSIYNLWKHSLIGKTVAVFYLILMTLSGIIDIFPIKNDGYAEIKDSKNNEVEQFIINNTPKDSVFLNASYTYNPASLAGRKIFLGWPYFVWSVGYDSGKRYKIMESVFQNNNKNDVCKLSMFNKIDYISLEDINDPNLPKINLSFFMENFKFVYENHQQNFYIIDVKKNCLELI